MTWGTRFKMLFGTMGVFILIAALTYVYTERESSATSATAVVSANTLPVGSDYGGKLVEQHVEEGAYVSEGDALFTIDSLGRQRDLEMEARAEAQDEAAESAETTDDSSPEPSASEASSDAESSDSASSDSASGDSAPGDSAPSRDADTESASDDEEFSPLWTVTASASGTVAEVPTGVGGYIPAGGIVAEVFEDDSLYVSADFLLTPRDFDRLQIGAPVEVRLPDRTTVTGTVDEIEVATEDGAARAFVRVASEDIAHSDPAGLTAPGTPVHATVELRDDGPLAGLRDTATDFLEKIGL
ncbi:HlyD family efflux transporter periplasmic adaptor subunit [Demequina muriae]|uniref:HlyD family efflux transporter periplasmic adaptor subunit n=1 Tax=Demequina muriae TaxID=3051664 RepID=A0ABT8GH68_9MICO|nr:HlyD family efflux transporter periplasmic adaptor subunit [Demequina sp. EGI L300058]MDN4480778.1 HlyD family efflux transporter periplasmic adaptor subunit [Demequina sp. EGI L300058]